MRTIFLITKDGIHDYYCSRAMKGLMKGSTNTINRAQLFYIMPDSFFSFFSFFFSISKSFEIYPFTLTGYEIINKTFVATYRNR